MDQTFTRELNRKTSFTKGDVAIEYAELIRAVWSGQYRSIAPSDFKRIIGRYICIILLFEGIPVV